MTKQEKTKLARVDDVVLSLLIDLVEKGGSKSLPITLLCHGFLVTGKLCSSAEYAKSFDEQVGSELLSELFESDHSTDDRPEFFAERFSIHLTDAKFFSNQGNPIPAGSGVAWRGRLKEVAGFNFGTLELNKA